MDRVVCGDVGFGKTEVALRAAFVAATAGKQVAVLVPTTLLAAAALPEFPRPLRRLAVKVEVLSRFKSPKEIEAGAGKLAERPDRRHRSARTGCCRTDVRFKDLGLVIVDEEQRFGVRQKEALKTAARRSATC